MTSSDEVFESRVAHLTNLLTEISNLQLALNCSLTGPLKNNPHARRMQTVIDDMGTLIDESMETADELIASTRKRIAKLKETKTKERTTQPPPANVCSSSKEKQSGCSSDASLVARTADTPPREGFMYRSFVALPASVPPTGTVVHTRHVEAAYVEQFGVVRGSETQGECKFQQKQTWTHKEIFDLMSQKPDTSRSPSSSVRKVKYSPPAASGSVCGPQTPKTAKKIKKHRVAPYGSPPSARQSDRSHKQPLCICDWRGRTIQREYAFLYEGKPEPVWKAPRHTTGEEMKLIIKFKAEARRDKPRAGHSVERQPGQLYNVEKIVGHRMTKHGKKEYVVKWDGYDSSENTWEPAAKLRAEVPRVVDEYERGLAVQASRLAKLETQAEETAKHSAAETANELALSAAQSAFLDEEEEKEGEEDSEIERMASSDRDTDSDSDASE